MLSHQRKRNRLASLLRLDDLHRHSLTLSKHAYPRLLDNRDVDENILRDVDENILVTVLGDGEAEALYRR